MLYTSFNFLAMPHGIWDFSSQPEIEPVLPALEAGFLTTGLLGKSLSAVLDKENTQ